MHLLQDLVKGIVLCAIFLFGPQFVMPQSGATYQTFGFRNFEATVLSPYQMIHVSQENAQFVKSHVRRELENHGLSSTTTPDIYVDLFVHLKLESQETGGHISNRGVSIYEVGTLTVKLNNAAKNELLWQGSRTIPLWKKKEQKIRKRVERMVARIFKDFDKGVLYD